jgi:dihydropteroate synthase
MGKMHPRLYLTPRAVVYGKVAAEAVETGSAWPFLGDHRAFAAIEVTKVAGRKVESTLLPGSAFESSPRKDGPAEIFALPRKPFAGLELSRPRLMGIINVTPDSFSDGGAFFDPDHAIAHGIALAKAGADILDVGGESTRPGARPVSVAEELRRIVPVVRDLAKRGYRVSIDTRHAKVMDAAIAAGACIVNDVTALTGDPESLPLVAKSRVFVVLMHMRGNPRTMQRSPRYAWTPGEVFTALAERIERCRKVGIARERIAVDPGIGFGKTAAHSVALLDHIAMFHGLGCPVVLGASRKSFIGAVAAGEGVHERLPGSLAVAVHAVLNAVQILRVHDVAETRQALALAAAINAGLAEPAKN